jgi:hypothetical protein
VSRWQRDHEGSRRNAIGKFRCGHGLCAGDGGRLGLNWPVPKYLFTLLAAVLVISAFRVWRRA